MTELTNWRQLSDGGRDLVLCLDFPGGRPAAGFAELAAGLRIDASFLHVGQAGGAPLAACVDSWVAQVAATGRPVRAVLGFCAGTALATRVTDALATTGSPPVVVLFDAVTTTAGSLAAQFNSTLEASAEYLTEDELVDARDLAEHLVATDTDDLPGIVAALTDRYDLLIRAVADRLSLPEFFRQELINGFTSYLDYLLLASQGGFDMRTTTPLFVTSAEHELPVTDVRTVTLDVGHADLLRDPEVHKFVTDLLTGEQPW